MPAFEPGSLWHRTAAPSLYALLAYSWSSHTGMSGADSRMARVSVSLLYCWYRVLSPDSALSQQRHSANRVDPLLSALMSWRAAADRALMATCKRMWCPAPKKAICGLVQTVIQSTVHMWHSTDCCGPTYL